MVCEISFLPVGNADCIVIHADDSVVIVDLGKNPRSVYNWLRRRNFNRIDRIYITHNHQDHFPFSSFKKLVDFLELWFSNGSEMGILSLPDAIYETAFSELDNLLKVDNLRYQELKDAVDLFDLWDQRGKVRAESASRSSAPYALIELKMYVLHPRQLFISRTKNKQSKINEISLVLKVVYGEFAAMLLADLAGNGLKDYLSVVKASSAATKEAKANIVKIPHHGGFPSNGNDLKELLTLIDAELAVLSVGSNNPYGHVEPNLFKALIELQNNKKQHLKQFNFICTEVTRTCVYSASERSVMSRSETRLPPSENCAGEITIIAELSGKWKYKTGTPDHASRVANFDHAACDGRADLE